MTLAERAARLLRFSERIEEVFDLDRTGSARLVAWSTYLAWNDLHRAYKDASRKIASERKCLHSIGFTAIDAPIAEEEAVMEALERLAILCVRASDVVRWHGSLPAVALPILDWVLLRASSSRDSRVQPHELELLNGIGVEWRQWWLGRA